LNLSALEDTELIHLAKKGSRSAFTEMVNRYENTVAKTVIGMLGHCDEADDVGQETFIRFYKSLERFRGDASLGTYLTRIAINLSLNEIKRQKSFNYRYEKLNDDSVAYKYQDSDKSDSSDTKEIVNYALQELDVKFRSVIILRMIHGYSTKETSKILKIPRGTVLSRLARAQDKLKEILKIYLIIEN